MSLEEVIKALEEVHRMCQAKPFCNKECPFYNRRTETFNDCFLGPIPENWEIDEIDTKEGGD